MNSTLPLTFKIATEESELEQIYKLNYRTFVEEIPQHHRNPAKALVDKFHDENTYVICLCNKQLLGMITMRGKRPFSLDQKLEDLDSYLPSGRSVCEVRLLAVEKNHRGGAIFHGLLSKLVQYGKSQGYDLVIISGALRQRKLYEHLGFVPFGPQVGTADARYQPMCLTLETWEERSKAFLRPDAASAASPEHVNLLPGPVGINRQVRNVFGELPVSHRSEAFVRDFQRTQQSLCELVAAQRVEIFLGSGTLANDVVAGQLSLLSSSGLILSNGEFGERLIDHATRLGLSFETFQTDWGLAFEKSDLEQALDRARTIGWVWAVHCETSTGILNNITLLKELCKKMGIRLCLDCIGSIGTVPLDLAGVYLASGTSGKGLGSFPGLSMVFYNHKAAPALKRLPRYLDLGFYASSSGVPFTTSSNLLYALQASLQRFQAKAPFDHISTLSIWLRARLREQGLQILAPDPHASPAVITLVLPPSISSEQVGQRLEQSGYLLSYKSEYLLKRNWIQICLMGECSQETMIPLLKLLQEFSPEGCRAS